MADQLQKSREKLRRSAFSLLFKYASVSPAIEHITEYCRMRWLLQALIMYCSVTLIPAQDIEIFTLPFEATAVGFLGMAQDKQGYVWLVDNGNGLFRYGGDVTLNYRPQEGDPNTIISGRIENIMIDSEGIIWLPTFDQGLDRFDPELEIFTHFQHGDDPGSIRSNGFRDVVEDNLGNIWVGTNIGLDRFDRKTGVFHHHHSDDPEAKILDKEHIRSLYVDRAGILWIGAGSPFETELTTGGLFSLDPSSGEMNLYRHSEAPNSLIDNRVRAIYEDSRGVFWIGTAGDGLHTMDRGQGSFQRHTYDPQNPNKLSRGPIADVFPSPMTTLLSFRKTIRVASG